MNKNSLNKKENLWKDILEEIKLRNVWDVDKLISEMMFNNFSTVNGDELVKIKEKLSNVNKCYYFSNKMIQKLSDWKLNGSYVFRFEIIDDSKENSRKVTPVLSEIVSVENNLISFRDLKLDEIISLYLGKYKEIRKNLLLVIILREIVNKVVSIYSSSSEEKAINFLKNILEKFWEKWLDISILKNMLKTKLFQSDIDYHIPNPVKFKVSLLDKSEPKFSKRLDDVTRYDNTSLLKQKHKIALNEFGVLSPSLSTKINFFSFKKLCGHLIKKPIMLKTDTDFPFFIDNAWYWKWTSNQQAFYSSLFELVERMNSLVKWDYQNTTIETTFLNWENSHINRFQYNKNALSEAIPSIYAEDGKLVPLQVITYFTPYYLPDLKLTSWKSFVWENTTWLSAWITEQETKLQWLLEVIEHRSINLNDYEEFIMDKEGLDWTSIWEIIDKFWTIIVRKFNNPLWVPVFWVFFWENSWFGAHLNWHIALVRAFSELGLSFSSNELDYNKHIQESLIKEQKKLKIFEIENFSQKDSWKDLEILENLLKENWIPPIYVDLTREYSKIRVFKVIVPELFVKI